MEDIWALVESEFAGIAESPSGEALPAISKMSKLFLAALAYLEGLEAVSPCYRGTADPFAIGFAGRSQPRRSRR